MSIYTDRWNSVHELFMTKIVPAFDDPTIDVLFDGQKIERTQLIIGDQLIEVEIQGDRSHCTYTIYNGDLELDEGVYDPETDTAERIRRDFKLYRRIDF